MQTYLKVAAILTAVFAAIVFQSGILSLRSNANVASEFHLGTDKRATEKSADVSYPIKGSGAKPPKRTWPKIQLDDESYERSWRADENSREFSRAESEMLKKYQLSLTTAALLQSQSENASFGMTESKDEVLAHDMSFEDKEFFDATSESTKWFWTKDHSEDTLLGDLDGFTWTAGKKESKTILRYLDKNNKEKKKTWSYDNIDQYVREKRQANGNDPFVTQMASIANRIYNFGNPVAGWYLVKAYDWGRSEQNYGQNIGIYKRPGNGKCVFSLSGTNFASPRDILVNAKGVWSVPWCGLQGVHKGYAMRLNHWMNSTRYKEFMQFLNDPQNCPEGVIGTGHSMGGALAMLMAYCGQQRREFSVQMLYTFGAPGVSEEQMQNPSSPLSSSQDVCFPGYRVFNADKKNHDTIASLAQKYGYKHPRMPVVRLQKNEMGTFTAHQAKCNVVAARDCPDKNAIPNLWYRNPNGTFLGPYLKCPGPKSSKFGLHSCTLYIKNLLQYCKEDTGRDDDFCKEPHFQSAKLQETENGRLSASPSQAKPRLPDGWVAVVSRTTGDTYYHNTNTGETTWDVPGQGAAHNQ